MTSKEYKAKRASNDERQDRFRDIEALLNNGYKTADIARVLERRYKISSRQAERDVKTVKELRCQAILSQDVSTLRADQYSKSNHLFQILMKDKDYANALKVLTFQDQLSDKLEGQPIHAKVSSFQDNDLAHLMAALETSWTEPESRNA